MNSLKGKKKDFLCGLGYCPQFDAIIGTLSGREMLTLFCHLRGVPRSDTRNEVDKWLHKLGLEKSGDVPCGSYSGGMKRRLSVGIAMIGDPPVVLLDEPTSGVDPVSRRQFWDVISAAQALGQSVILTSHSMDEIEVLCSRLGIMVNGRFQCLGSVEYLRNKFAHGYTLVLRLKHHHPHNSPVANHLKNEILSRFTPCEIQDEHQNIMQFQLNDSDIPWDVIFQNMEELKKVPIPTVAEIIAECKRRNSLRLVMSENQPTYGSLIEDYTVSLTSLEEVFLSFARKQYSSRNANNCC
jgi:ATP-binding cassette subfamily A (ABC1) protein 3